MGTVGLSIGNLQRDEHGHLEVAVHGPLLPFGSVHAEKLTPIFQVDAVYGINLSMVQPTTGRAIAGAGSATVTGTNNVFRCSTGTTSYSYGTMQSRRRLRYRASQGLRNVCTGRFSARADNAYLLIGGGTSESGFYFGYAHLPSAGLNSTEFGILHVTGGVRAIHTLTVSAHTATSGDVSVTLDSATAVTVAVLSGDSITAVANKIAAATYPGWQAEAQGSTVVFLAADARPRAGTFTATGAGVTASFATTTAGVTSTDTFYPQSDWNGDKLDGSGFSGVVLNPQMMNVYRIDTTYLGSGPVTFRVMLPTVGANNATWVTVHTLNFPNTLETGTSVSQPSFPFTMTAYSAGSTTDVWVESASFAGFIEGEMKLTGPRASFENVSQTVSSSGYNVLFSVRNGLVHSNAGTSLRANQSVMNLLSFGGAHDDATPVRLFVLRNPTLAGTPNWTKWSADSCMYIDTAATTATITSNSQIVEALPIGQGAGEIIPFEDLTTVQPGEVISVCARTVTGTATYTIGLLNGREDQ